MEVEQQTVELTIFESEHDLFLPFVDALANQLTYPAGRYLEPELIGNGKVRIDFNLAYNPYCAYNDRWSCPLTPFENRLNVPRCAPASRSLKNIRLSTCKVEVRIPITSASNQQQAK